MTQLDDLLRDALRSDVPASTGGADPVAQIERRVRRARVWLVSAATVSALVVAAGIAVPLAMVKPAHRSTDRVLSAPAPTQDAQHIAWWPGTAGAATPVVGGGYAWTLARAATPDDVGVVAQRDASTGQLVASIDVPGPAEWLAFGLDRVWVAGGGDASNPDAGAISMIDPATKAVTTHHYADRSRPSGVAFAGGIAWFGLYSSDRVDGFRPDAQLDPAVSVRVPGGPADVIATGEGRLWVHTIDNAQIVDVDVTDAKHPAVGKSYPWSGRLFAAGPAGTIWTTDGQRVVLLTPALLKSGTSVATGTRIATPGAPFWVTPSAGGGLWVILSVDSSPPWSIGYYSPASLRAADPQPDATAKVSAAVVGMDDPDSGGLLFVAAAGAGVWSPPEAGR